MKGDSWHQCISVEINDGNNYSIEYLEKILLECGFLPSKDKELYSLPRNEKVEEWQTGSIVDVIVEKDNEEVCFNHEGYSDWNKIKLEYLLPWLPIENVDTFVLKIEQVAKLLAMPVRFDGNIYNSNMVVNYAKECAADLESRMEAPGGEFLAQAIAMDLPV